MSATFFLRGRSRGALFAFVIAGLFALSTAASAVSVFASGGTLIQISSDPYTNSSSQHATEVEPDVLAHGSTLVSAFQAGRFFDGGGSNIGWATSTDSGKSWRHGFLPGTTIYAKPKGTYARVTDPAVAYDAKHKVWLIESIPLDSAGFGVGVIVASSVDGLMWKKPVIVTTAGSGHDPDKSWIACDSSKLSTFYGHCYIEYDDHTQGNLIQMSTSTDGGATWSTPEGTQGSADGFGGQPLVQPNGTVIVPIDDAFTTNLLSFTSHDGGKTWSAPITVTSITRNVPAGSLRALDLSSAVMDKSGKVYDVFYDCRFESGCTANDLVMTTTMDGVKWSPVVRIPADEVGSGVDHFIPGIGVDRETSGKSAHIVVAFYYYTNANCGSNCLLNIGYVTSTNGGKSWSARSALASGMQLTWLANTSQGYMVGDYMATAFSHGKAYPVVASAGPPKGGALDEPMATSIMGLDVVGGSVVAGGEGVVAVHAQAGALQSSR